MWLATLGVGVYLIETYGRVLRVAQNRLLG